MLVWEKYAAIIGGFVLFVAAIFFGGVHYESLKFDKYKSDQMASAAKADADSQAHARRVEENDSIQRSHLNATATAASQAVVKSQAATIAQLRTGNLWLSSQLASSRGGVSAPGAIGSGLDPTGAGRLPIDTAEFLVNESARADGLAVKFNKAVANLAQDRLTCDGTVK